MASFSYKAISTQGKTVQGAIAADRIELASRELRSQGLTLLSLEPAREGAVVPTGAATGGADNEAVLAMTRELAVLLRAGLPIDRALKVMIDMAAQPRLGLEHRARGRGQHGPLAVAQCEHVLAAPDQLILAGVAVYLLVPRLPAVTARAG